jgi:hypothetical protein
MDEQEEKLRTALMEGMLEYIEGRKSYKHVLIIGVTAHNKRELHIPPIAEVVSELTLIESHVTDGKSYSKDELKEIFTAMLEKLTK